MSIDKETLTLELALQNGMKAEIVNDRVVITIDTKTTSRDLWDGQIELWLSNSNLKTISSAYLRIIKNKLNFKKS